MMKITARIFPLFLLAGILIGCSAGYENADNIPHSFAVDEEQEVGNDFLQRRLPPRKFLH